MSDLRPRAGAPSAEWSRAWYQLTGYVTEAVADGLPLDAVTLLAYMTELKRNALAPIREWMTQIGIGESDE